VAELRPLVEFLDDYLQVHEIDDYPGSLNGLQFEPRGPIDRIAAATDASLVTIGMAAKAGARLMLVHHGLFWGDPKPMIGARHRRFRSLFEADLGVYAAHLPLDLHAEVGNGTQLCVALGFEPKGRFGSALGNEGIGVTADMELDRDELMVRVAETCAVKPYLVAGGPEEVRRLGIVTGGGSSMLEQAAEAGLDTFVTGEGAHHTYHEATELGINVIFAGHYATETFGVKALAEKVASEFDLGWEFLDFPTGL